jgi:signal transduction histidine kinase/ActR/RegA family two-component response regulator
LSVIGSTISKALSAGFRGGTATGKVVDVEPPPTWFDPERSWVVGSEQGVGTVPERTEDGDELQRALAELRQANERLVSAGVRMQELADEAEDARKAAEEANRAKDEFLATLSHELRTPLNAILGWTHILRHSAVDSATIDRALAIIERNARLQSQLIADLLQVSQIITGKLRLNVEPTDLAPLVEAEIDGAYPAAAAKAISIESHIEPGVGPVLADPSRIQQIVWNVLSNAIKFTPRDGRIQIILRQIGSAAEISVRDSGVGIDGGLLPYVFDRFRQGDGTSHRAFGGLGLGLAIVRQLMQLHGGTVKAESDGDDRGSTFTLTFPIPALTTAARDHVTRTPGSQLLRGLRVLVVEDEPDSRELMTCLLRGKGAAVTAVSSVREAVAQFNGHAPDLMIADIGLPDQDGYELIRQVRAFEDSDARSTPAIALTAYVRPQDHEKALAAGFQLHVGKPVDPDDFIGIVADVARHSKRI